MAGGAVQRGELSDRCRTFHTVTTQVAAPVQPQRGRALGGECISSIKGTISTTVLIIHNHPSGDPTPSPDDHELTRRLAAAGVVMGIDLVDHIVLGDSRYCSFKEMGKL
jgi:hypothetical protein